jgi:outer membrane protein assembly factor BamB
VRWDVPGPGDGTPAVAGDVLALIVPKRKEKDAPHGLFVYRLGLDKPTLVAHEAARMVAHSASTDGRSVYVTSLGGNPGNGTRLCLNAATGEVVWKARNTVTDQYTSFAVAGETLFAWCAPHRDKGVNKVAFYRAKTGELIREYTPGRLGECCFPVVSGEYLVWRGLENLQCYRLRK